MTKNLTSSTGYEIHYVKVIWEWKPVNGRLDVDEHAKQGWDILSHKYPTNRKEYIDFEDKEVPSYKFYSLR